MFGCYLFKTCSFEIGDRKGVDLEVWWGGEELGKAEGEENIITIDCFRNKSISIKEKWQKEYVWLC